MAPSRSGTQRQWVDYLYHITSITSTRAIVHCPQSLHCSLSHPHSPSHSRTYNDGVLATLDSASLPGGLDRHSYTRVRSFRVLLLASGHARRFCPYLTLSSSFATPLALRSTFTTPSLLATSSCFELGQPLATF